MLLIKFRIRDEIQVPKQKHLNHKSEMNLDASYNQLALIRKCSSCFSSMLEQASTSVKGVLCISI